MIENSPCIICDKHNEEYEQIFGYVKGQYMYAHRECLIKNNDLELIGDFCDYERCPKCLYQCNQESEDSDLKRVTNEFNCGSVYSWTEHWKCPECEHEWEVDNGT